MSTNEILKELQKLTQKDRRAIIRRLLELQNRETLNTDKKYASTAGTTQYSELGLLMKNPSFDFLREEPDLYE
jgi:hypothetical protein